MGVAVTSRYSLKADPYSSHSVILEWLGEGRGRCLLDVGAADGLLSRHLTARGWRVTGLEADPEAARAGAKHCEQMIVADLNQDGSADDTRMIAGAVGIQCGTIDVPIDIDMSYWNPSGNQQKPAMGGFDALGPALVVIPSAGLPTNTECRLRFAPDIVDKQGIQVCAPPGGDVTQNCTPGDVGAFKFTVEPK